MPEESIQHKSTFLSCLSAASNRNQYKYRIYGRKFQITKVEMIYCTTPFGVLCGTIIYPALKFLEGWVKQFTWTFFPPAGKEEHDKEGRVITAEFTSFFLVTAYVPNAGRGLVRLDYRKTWDVDFRAYLSNLDSRKPLVLCGDLNVAHQEIDLKNPKGNRKNAGFTPEEREGFSQLLAAGFTDSFRELYPEQTNAYTFWTYMMNSRAKNVGWRLDYFVLSAALLPSLCDSKIRNTAMGSDHCPITLHLAT